MPFDSTSKRPPTQPTAGLVKSLIPHRSRRRLRRFVALLCVAIVALFVFIFFRARSDARVPNELATSQWQQLTRRMARSAETDREHSEPGHVVPPDRKLEATATATAERTPSPAIGPVARPKPVLVDTATSSPGTVDSRAALLARQAAEYDARQPKSVIELQKFRRTYATRIVADDGRTGRAELIDLNPRFSSWYLLQLTWAGEQTKSFHLTSSHPGSHRLTLDPSFPTGLVLEGPSGRAECDLWSSDTSSSLAAASRLARPYVTLCDDEVVLRRPTAGRRTSLEWATDFLRDNLWGGEKITVLVRDSLYKDAHLMTTLPVAAAVDPLLPQAVPGLPVPARIDTAYARDLLTPVDLALPLDGEQGRVRAGAWTPVRDNSGVFVSVIEPKLVARDLLASAPRRAGRLDPVEAGALTYLVAFDLSHFDLDYSIGTDHPRVGWSERVRPEMRDDSLPGPDGIGDLAPLVAGGIVPFSLVERTVATFAGGFKRSHGAFKTGELARRNYGSHYGFIESGVVLSKLQPGLATIFELDDGVVRMKTWSRDDDVQLERVRWARQNGVPIVETDVATGESIPGALVSRWGDGNWSGSEDRKLRSVRAGICLQESAAGRFLLYGYFSSATPTAMARVFLSYGCSYAMITDMNALEHTYLALYRVEGSALVVDHLIAGMEVLDKTVHGQTLPRFLGFADNRDFFYVVRRSKSGATEFESAAGDPGTAPVRGRG